MLAIPHKPPRQSEPTTPKAVLEEAAVGQAEPYTCDVECQCSHTGIVNQVHRRAQMVATACHSGLWRLQRERAESKGERSGRKQKQTKKSTGANIPRMQSEVTAPRRNAQTTSDVEEPARDNVKHLTNKGKTKENCFMTNLKCQGAFAILPNLGDLSDARGRLCVARCENLDWDTESSPSSRSTSQLSLCSK